MHSAIVKDWDGHSYHLLMKPEVTARTPVELIQRISMSRPRPQGLLLVCSWSALGLDCIISAVLWWIEC